MKPNSFTLEGRGILNQLITPVKISLPFMPNGAGPHPNFIQFNALWDTGATNTVISKNVVDALGLQPTGQIYSHHANGVSEVNTYLANVFLPNNIGVPFLKISEGVLQGFDVLIGMDIIARGDFALTHKDGNTTFSFRIPSIGKIDFIKETGKEPESVRQVPSPAGLNAVPVVSRNAPCPCGSKKKYKHCHAK